MARWIAENRIVNPDDLRAFDVDGYRFDAAVSGEDQWIFSRPQPPPVKPARARARAKA